MLKNNAPERKIPEKEKFFAWLVFLFFIAVSGSLIYFLTTLPPPAPQIQVPKSIKKASKPEKLPQSAKPSEKASTPGKSIEKLVSSVEISTRKPLYEPDEPIIVDFFGMPGNKQDWLTIVNTSTPDNISKEWFYTNGRQSGSLPFNGLPVGNYEVRVYFDWPKGGYVVKQRYRFAVVSKNMVGKPQ